MKVVIFLALILSFSVSAAPQKKPQTLNETMADIGKTMQKIFPLLFHRDQFLEKKNEKKIGEAFDSIIKDLEKSEVLFKEMPMTYSVVHGATLDHFKETRRVFKKGNKDFAQIMARSSVNFCMACHTQDHAGRTLFPNAQRSQFPSSFEFAEFNYMTREYKTAIKYYDDFINHEEDREGRNVFWALRRKVSIFAELLKDPDMAVADLSKHLNDPKFPEMFKSDLIDWINAFKKWKTEDEFKTDGLNFVKIKSYVDKYLSQAEDGIFMTKGENLVRYMRLRTILYDYMWSHPQSNEMPEVLYFLSLSERVLNMSIFYSLGNLYLKQCVVKYPNSAIAKKCYDEYEGQMQFSYSGSSGSHLPKDIVDELRELKKLIQKPAVDEK